MEYGIGINNRYAFLTGDDEHDPMEAVAAKDKENKKIAAAATGQTVSAPKTAPPKPAVNKQPSSAPAINLKRTDGQGQNARREGGNQRGGDNRREGGNQRDQRPKGDRIIRQSNQAGEGGRREGGERPEGGYRGPRPDRPRREGDDNQERRNNFRNRREQDGDAPRPFRQNNDNNVAFGTEGRPDEFRPKRREGEGGNFRGGPRGERGAYRGRGGAGGGNRRREFDRHSGSNTTGVKAEDKRGGSGSYNWGTTQDDVEAQTAEPTETLERSGDEQGLAAADVPTSGDEAPAADVEEAPKELTLEEYRKIEEEKRFKSNLKLRKAGEGEDTKQWKKTFLLEKQKNDEEEIEYEEIIIEEPHGRKRQVLDIKINWDKRDSGFGERRGGGRGRGGDRGGRGGRPPFGDRDREPRGDREPREPRGDREPREPRGDRPPRRDDDGGDRPPRREDRPRGPPPQAGDRPRRGGGQFRGKDSQSAPKVDDLQDFPNLAA